MKKKLHPLTKAELKEVETYWYAVWNGPMDFVYNSSDDFDTFHQNLGLIFRTKKEAKERWEEIMEA